VAPPAPLGPVCPEHALGSCPPWLPRFYPDHGNNPCISPPPPAPAPLAPDEAGPSNWAGPAAMDIEPAPRMPPPSFTTVCLRRR
jgi:hypothetical protein